MASGIGLLLLTLFGILGIIFIVGVLVAVGMFAADITLNAKPPHPHVRRH
jgi:hypothetical protein